MRLRWLALENYGPFQAERLELDDRPGRVNLLLAPNGAGKSVLRLAFRDFLFGIGAQTPMGFRFGYRGMRLVGEAVGADGTATVLARRKGQGHTLEDAAGGDADPALMAGLIGGADRALFDRLFALDTALLRDGARRMLAAGGDLAESLYAAGGGTAAARRVREGLEAERDALAPMGRVASRPLYAALDAYHEAGRALRSATVLPEAWEDRALALAEVRRGRAALAGEQARVNDELAEVGLVRRIRPWLARADEARRALEALTGAPALPPEAGAAWRQAADAAARTREGRARAAETLAAARGRLAEAGPEPAVIAAAAEIEGLTLALGAIIPDRRDLPRRKAERAVAAARRDGAITALGPGGYAPPPVPCLAAARALIARHAGLTDALAAARRAATRSARALEEETLALAALGVPADVAVLADLAAEARAGGREPAERLADLARQGAAAAARVEAALAKVPLWRGDAALLAALAVPGAAMADAAGKALAEATLQHGQAEGAVARLEGELLTAAGRLAAVRTAGPLPDGAAVAAARDHRDRGWALIRAGRFDGRDVEVEAAAFAGPQGLPAAYEQAVAAADRLADQRDGQASRIAAAAEIEHRQAELAAALAAAEAEHAAAGRLLAEARAAWTRLLGRCGLPDDARPADLAAFLAARELVLDRRCEAEVAAAMLDGERARQAAHLAQLAPLLCAAASPSLDAALRLADARIAAAAKARAAIALAAERVQALRSAHGAAREDLEAAEAVLAAWSADWEKSLAELGRPPGEAPAAVEAVIRLLEEAGEASGEVRDLDHRIAGMGDNIAAFGERVGRLGAALAPEAAGEPTEAIVGALKQKLALARRIEAERRVHVEQEEAARLALEAAEGVLATAALAKARLGASLGGGADGEIEARLADAGRRRAAEAALADADGRVREIAGARPLAALIAAARAREDAALEAAELTLRDEAGRIADAREAAAAQEQRLDGELRAMTQGSPALDAEHRRQSAAASVARITGEALILHGAASLMRAALERLQAGRGAGVLGRIGQAFAGITGGAFAGVDAVEDDGGEVRLVAVEADGRTFKAVEALSEGTRDQLFLAMRLIMLADYAAGAPALPFIADDLLQTFDDRRSGLALDALIGLSEHVQVILLTHHRHVLDLARRLHADSVRVLDLAA